MFKKFKEMFGLDKPKMMKDPNIEREAAAEAARKKREDEENNVRVVRPSEIHRQEFKNVGKKKNLKRRGTDTPPTSHYINDKMANATPKQLEAAMKRIAEADDDKAA